MKKLKCVAISDTHQLHHKVQLSDDIDILIHAGDFCSGGRFEEALKFVGWFVAQKAKYKIFIAGNHDRCMEDPQLKAMVLDAIKHAPNVFYLEDSMVEIEGRKIYGSPWQPEFCNWAFNLPRGPALKAVYDKLPDSIDALITHGPPRGVLDLIPLAYMRFNESQNVGCDDLSEAVSRVKPKVHVFGHIHNSYGRYLGQDTEFINAAICSERYQAVNAPQEFYL